MRRAAPRRPRARLINSGRDPLPSPCVASRIGEGLRDVRPAPAGPRQSTRTLASICSMLRARPATCCGKASQGHARGGRPAAVGTSGERKKRWDDVSKEGAKDCLPSSDRPETDGGPCIILWSPKILPNPSPPLANRQGCGMQPTTVVGAQKNPLVFFGRPKNPKERPCLLTRCWTTERICP
jgi:hypothetical protein